MSKKRKGEIPLFGKTKTPSRDPKSVGAAPAKQPVTVQRAKPPATSAKSGRRGG